MLLNQKYWNYLSRINGESIPLLNEVSLYDEPLILAQPFDHHVNHKKEPIHIV